MPAKRIIILDKEGRARFKYAIWADVPVARQTYYVRQGATSVWRGASQTENDDIASGKVVEKVDIISKPGASVAQIQAELEAAWQAFQDEVDSYNPWTRYGTYWDNLGAWTIGGAS